MTSKLFLLIFLKNAKISCPGCIYNKSYHPKCFALDSIAEIMAGLGPPSYYESFFATTSAAGTWSLGLEKGVAV